MSSRGTVLVIGAGPAGLTAAYELLKSGFDVTVLEASGRVGGMAASFELFGQIVDCGPHRFFSGDRIVNDFFHEIVEEEYTLVNRQTRIYFNNRFFDYPLTFSNVLRNLSLKEIAAILFSYMRQRIFPNRQIRTFEDWVSDRFGRKLFSMFFQTYSNSGVLAVIGSMPTGHRSGSGNYLCLKR